MSLACPFIQDVAYRHNKQPFKFIEWCNYEMNFCQPRLLKEKAMKLRVLNIAWSNRVFIKP